MDTDSFVVEVETDDFYKDISNNVNEWFDTSNFPPDLNRPLQKGLNKKVIAMTRDVMSGEIIKKFIALRPKAYSYITDNEKVFKKAKSTNRATIKNNITHYDYYTFLFNKNIKYCEQQRIRSYNHNVYTETINKIALSYTDDTDDKRMQVFDKIHSYRYGTNPYLLCKHELWHKYKIIDT